MINVRSNNGQKYPHGGQPNERNDEASGDDTIQRYIVIDNDDAKVNTVITSQILFRNLTSSTRMYVTFACQPFYISIKFFNNQPDGRCGETGSDRDRGKIPQKSF